MPATLELLATFLTASAQKDCALDTATGQAIAGRDVAGGDVDMSCRLPRIASAGGIVLSISLVLDKCIRRRSCRSARRLF